MATQNIEKLTNDQLRAFLFGPKENISFIEATAEYMANVTATQSKQVTDSSATLSLETDAQSTMIDLTKAQNVAVQKAYQEEAEMQASSMPSWLGCVISGLMLLISCLTLDPVIIGMATAMFIMSLPVLKHGETLQQGMVTAAVGNDPTKQAEFEAGIAVGEAMICGGANMACSEEGFAGTMLQIAGRLALNSLSFLGQTLMMNNFWVSFFQGPCKMSPEDAALLGMFVGMGVAIGTSFFASDNALAQTLKGNLAARFGAQTDKIMRLMMLGLTIGMAGFQVTSGILQIQIGEQYLRLADFHRDVMAPVTARMALLEGLLNGWNPIIEITQSGLSTLADIATEENQTFSSLGDMFRAAQ